MTPAIPMPEEEELNMKFAELVVRTEAERNFRFFTVGLGPFFFKFNFLIRGCFLELCTTGMRYRKCKIAFWHRIL